MMEFYQTPIPVYAFNGLMFLGMNLLWAFLVEVLLRVTFEFYLSRQVINNKQLKIVETPLSTWSLHAFTDGSLAMRLRVYLLCILFVTSSLTLEFGFDAGTYFKYKPAETSVLIKQTQAEFDALNGRAFLEASGYLIANTVGCVKPMHGVLREYESNSSALPLRRRYDGDYSIYFPVTNQTSGQPFCSNIGVQVKGAVAMFVGISAARDRGLTVQREETINPAFVGLGRAITDAVDSRLKSPSVSNATFVDAAGISRDITVAPGVACKTLPGQQPAADRQLCYVEFLQPYVVEKDAFTHALVAQSKLNASMWFAHALIRKPDSVRLFRDHGWYQTYFPGSSYRVEHMPMALFFLDEPALKLGPSFLVLHAVGHLLAAGPDYRFSARRETGASGVRFMVRSGTQTSATISVAGCVALGTHALLLLIALIALCVETILLIRARRTKGGSNLPFRAVHVSRRWLERLFLASEGNFGGPMDPNSHIVVTVEREEIVPGENPKTGPIVRVVLRQEHVI